MLKAGPSTTARSSSAVAPAALRRLQGLEKHLKNEDSAFSGEIMQYLEDTVAAIKELEEIRRYTIECLEEETIKNSNLRFRVRNFPGEIMAEMAALVAAARESSTAKINQLQSALKSITDEIALLEEKETLCERQHDALCEELQYLRKQYKEIVDSLNEKIAVKINTNVLLIETCDKIRDTEKEIIGAKAALAELQEQIPEKISKLEKALEECDKKKREMKIIRDTQQAETSKKKQEFENLNVKLLDLQPLISRNSTAISNEESRIAKLKEKSNKLEKKLELEKKNMLALSEKKIQLESELFHLQSKYAQEKEDFDKELRKTKEDLHNAKCLNKKLRLENEAARQKYEQLLEEERDWAIERDEVVAKLGELSPSLNGKLQLLEDKKMEEKNLEKKIENLEARLLNMRKTCAEKLASLTEDLKTENKRRITLRWKLLYLAMQRKLFFSEEENINRKINEKTEAVKKRHAELLLEIEDVEKEIFQTETKIKALTEEASKRENYYKNYNEDFANKIKRLENDIRTATENLLKKEQELNTSRLILGEAQREMEQKKAECEELNKSVAEKQNEEVGLKRAIQQSIETTEKLKEDTLELRSKLRMKRDAAIDQLTDHTESMKLLERDIYEINRKTDLVNTENCRLKLRNAQMKEGIFAMNSEAEHHKSATVEILNDLAVLHDLLLKGSLEESFIEKEFLENEQEIQKAVAALTTKFQRREEKIGDINSRLEHKLEGLTSLFDEKSRIDDHCKI
ncbi:CAP-Gly domain-containing linker protein 1 isoform X2 [Columba livia]|uniref:CAP-Gly domain-containing linker protein 1 isoform X2 n=1 Tax=Columba livia TaxID=8932 RepID=UPI0031BA58C8